MLEELVSRFDAEKSLYEFMRQSWPYVEGDTPFVANWHLEALCEHLEAVLSGEIKNLLINVPPRTTKTTVISICFPAFTWIHNPKIQFAFGSYSKSLSHEASMKCRDLIASEWYQARWGDRFQLVGDQNKGKFDNDQKGHRIATRCWPI